MQKHCFCVLSVLLLLKGAFSGEIQDFLDRFHQNDYKLIPEWGEVISYNKHYFQQFEAKTFKYNRTSTAFNSTFLLNTDLNNDLEVIIQGFKFLSNEYRSFPALNFQINFCDLCDKNIAGFRSVYKCGNFTGCPLIKNKRIHTCNWTPDEAHFPPLIPTGRYMIEGKGVYHTTEMFVVRAYISVTRPMAIA